MCTAAFLAQSVCLDDTTVKFEIWDTAGQERYHSLAPMYYRGAQAAIVVFDITKPVQYNHYGLFSSSWQLSAVLKIPNKYQMWYINVAEDGKFIIWVG